MAREIKPRSQKNSNRIAVIGEGICEYYYLQSIRNIVNAHIKPLTVKDGVEYLENEIERCVDDGYERVYCLVDMDNKQQGVCKREYDNFIEKYNQKSIINRRLKTETYVKIVENHPCLEIWFYYYFKHTTGCFDSYKGLNPLKPKLEKVLPHYEKTEAFLRQTNGLHDYILSKGGEFDKALCNSHKSLKHHQGNSGAFSEMKKLFDEMLKEEVKQELSIYKKL